jgi:hypothetical protein
LKKPPNPNAQSNDNRNSDASKNASFNEIFHVLDYPIIF